MSDKSVFQSYQIYTKASFPVFEGKAPISETTAGFCLISILPDLPSSITNDIDLAISTAFVLNRHSSLKLSDKILNININIKTYIISFQIYSMMVDRSSLLIQNRFHIFLFMSLKAKRQYARPLLDSVSSPSP